jgi:hypothetical protein
VFALLILLAQAPASPADSTIIAAVRAAAEREPIEAMRPLSPHVPVKDVRLLDIDGDGRPEAFVLIAPRAQQTPPILVYTYDVRRGAHRLLEALVPGRLEVATGHLVDDHTLGVGMDFGPRPGTQPGDFDGMAKMSADSGISLVRYAAFVHTDIRAGFVDYVDLSDRALPTPDTKNCQDIEFSPVEAIAVGTVPGRGKARYLVVLTDSDVTLYRFRGILANGRLLKETAIRPRPLDVTGLATSADGEVQLVRGERTPPHTAPADPIVEPVPGQDALHVTDPGIGSFSKQPATNSAIGAKIADAANDYRQYGPVSRSAFYDFAWPKDTTEYRQMAGFGLILVTVVDQTAAELPFARVYIRTDDGRDSTLTLLGSIASEVPLADTTVRTVLGSHRLDALYLVPLAPEWRGGIIVIDFKQGRRGFRAGRVAAVTPPEIEGATTNLASRPDSNVVLAMIRREYPDFILKK